MEYEVKVLDIDVDDIIGRLSSIGAEYRGDFAMRRWVYAQSGTKEMVRLRSDGNSITLTYKRLNNEDIGGVEEMEVAVSDFAMTDAIFKRLGFDETYYQENKRKLYVLGNTEFCIDTWPLIPTYLEIESTSEAEVQAALDLLQITRHDGNIAVKSIYERYGIDLHSYPVMHFGIKSHEQVAQ